MIFFFKLKNVFETFNRKVLWILLIISSYGTFVTNVTNPPCKERIKQLSIYEFCTLLTIPPPPPYCNCSRGIKREREQTENTNTPCISCSNLIIIGWWEENEFTECTESANTWYKNFCKANSWMAWSSFCFSSCLQPMFPKMASWWTRRRWSRSRPLPLPLPGQPTARPSDPPLPGWSHVTSSCSGQGHLKHGPNNSDLQNLFNFHHIVSGVCRSRF